MKYRPLPSVEYLKECFIYEPETGVLTWKVRPLSHFPSRLIMNARNTRSAGREAGVINKKIGYRVVGINSCIHYAHRLIFKLMTGADPTHEIDHCNGIESDNRWRNLRAATHNQNMWNGNSQKNNRAGLKGVTLRTDTQKFLAQIEVHGQHKHLGYFHTAEAAHAAYCEAAKHYHGEFANFGQKESP